MEDWKQRTELLIGPQACATLQSAKVVIAGVGGVGAWCAEMLVRAGMGQMILLDSDTVEESNLNRQLVALHSTIGQNKVDILRERLLDINPDARIDSVCRYIDKDNVALLVPSDASLVVDAIDTVSPKLSLMQHCYNAQIPIVSCMGAGAKRDITQIAIADISKTFNCSLAAVIRKRLRKAGIKRGILTVFSKELPDPEAVVEVQEKNKLSSVGTISYVTGAFGCALTQAAISVLLKK